MKTTDSEIISLWTEYVDWPKREEQTAGLVRAILDSYGCKRVFNACAGDGFDSVSLLLHGYDVDSNEIDPNFRALARRNAFRNGIELEMSEHDWRALPDRLIETYDVVICLGNSFTYLFDRADRERTVANFVRLVKPGGIVVIDQRNYDYMLDEREHILANPQQNFRFLRQHYYCSETIDCYPASIEDRRIVLKYSRKDSGTINASLELYPIRRGELTALMQGADLDVEVYGDFELGKVGDVDFYQQVGVKK